MSHKNCPSRLKNRTFLFVITTVFLILSFGFLLSDIVYAQTSDKINLQGKIVRNDAGYEGLNVTEGSPACVSSGADTCDFQIKYYSASTAGTLYLTETFSDVEIGDYGGVFNLPLGTGSFTTTSECDDGTCNTPDEVIKEFTTLYIEIGFAPEGAGSFTEVFTRTELNASPYAIRSEYAAGSVLDSFKFYNSTNSTGITTTTGSVYYDTTDSELKLYDGSGWVSMGGGLWETSTVGTDYTAYMSATGIGTFDNFSLDTDGDRVSINSDQMEGGLSVFSSYSSTGGTFPLVSIKADHTSYAATLLELSQDGTGNIISGYTGSTLSFEVDNSGDVHLANDGVLYVENFSAGYPTGSELYPHSNEGCVYAYGGNIYWDSACSGTAEEILNGGTASTLWTDGGTFTYLSDTTEDLVLGASATAGAPFFFDVSEGRLGIGTDSPQAAIDIAGASSTISNTSGDITISPAGNLIVDQGKVGIGTSSPGYGLEVVGSSSYIQSRSSAVDSVAGLLLRNDAQQWAFETVGSQSDTLRVYNYTDGLVVAQFSKSGNFALGSDQSPDARLEILGSESTDYLNLSSSSGSDGDILTINNSGNVGIGTASPSTQLHTTGGVRFAGLSSSTETTAVMTDTNGNLSTRALGNLAFEDGVTGDNWGTQVVESDNTLTGTGIISSLLGLNLANANTWTGSQTFSASTYFPGSGIWDSSGNVGIGTTTPTSKLSIVGTGNLLDIASGGTSLFSVTDTQITSNLPHAFTSSGDVSMAYNLYMTNQTSSKIESYGPLSIVTGEPYESNNLTLKTYNSGRFLVESSNFTSDYTGVGIGTTTPSYLLDVSGTGVVGRFSGRVIGAEAVNSNELVTKSQLDAVGGTVYWQRASNNLSPLNPNDNVLPNEGGNLGASGTRWTNIYGSTGNFTNLAATTLTGGITGNSQNITGLNNLTGVTGSFSTSLTTPLVVGNTSLALRPSSDATTGIQLQNAAGTSILNVDTANSRVGIGTASPGAKVQAYGATSNNSVGGIIGSRYQINGTNYGSFGTYSKVGLVGAGYFSQIPNLPATPLGTEYAGVGVVGIGGGTSGSGWGIGVAGFGQTVAARTGLTAGGKFLANTNGDISNYENLYGVYTKADGTTNTVGSDLAYGLYSLAIGQGTDVTYGGYFSASGGGTNYGVYSAAGTNYFNGNVGIGTTSPSAMLSVGSSSQFTVNSTGNLTKVNNVAYSWPSTQGAASTVLTNNGSGTLTWSDVPGDNWGSQLVVSDATLVGDGSGNPLGINLANANTWSGVQTYDSIPAFNGGVSGTSSPFTVDSNTVVTNLNADLLDGNDASVFTTRNEVTNLGTVSFTSSTTTATFITELESKGAFDNYHSIMKASWSYAGNSDITDTGFGALELAGSVIETWTDNASDTVRGNIHIRVTRPTTGPGGSQTLVYNDQGSTYSPGWRQIWNSDTDGSGSGLNADLLDGLDSTAFMSSTTDDWVDVIGDTMTGTLNFSGVTNDITTAGTEHLALMPGGNVGIGTSSPGEELEINGDLKFSGAPTISHGSGNLNIQLADSTSRLYAQVDGANGMLSTFVNRNTNTGASAGSGFLFAAGGVNDWIGGMAAQRIDAASNSRTALRVLSNGSLTGTDATAVFYIEGAASGPKIIASGNVGIGATAPTELLHVSGGNVRIDNMTTAGIVKNSATGVLSGGNTLDASDITTGSLVNGTKITMGGTLTDRLVGTGDVTVGLSNSAAYSVLGNATSTLGAPSDIVAASDFQVLRRSGTSIGFGAINLASTNAVTGILAEGNGGTGQYIYTTGDILYASAANTLAKRAIGTENYVLTVSGGVPIWSATQGDDWGSGYWELQANSATGSSIISGSVVSFNGSNGIVTSRSGNNIGITPTYGSTANTIAQGNTGINVNTTGNLTGGSTGTAGGGLNVTLNTVNNPTFSTSVTTPTVIGSNALALKPGANSTTAIQLQNAAGTSILNVDTTNSRVGIGTTSPQEKLDVAGKIKVFDPSLHLGEIYSSNSNFDKTWTTNADFNATGTSFSSGMESPATNNELKLLAPTSSPYLYVYDININEYLFVSDFVGKATSKEKEYTSYTNITEIARPVNGFIKLKITEELEETSYIDKVFLRVNGSNQKIIELSSITNTNKDLLLSSDNQYFIMKKGDEYYLQFPAPMERYSKLEFGAEGYFIPQNYATTNENNNLEDNNSTIKPIGEEERNTQNLGFDYQNTNENFSIYFKKKIEDTFVSLSSKSSTIGFQLDNQPNLGKVNRQAVASTSENTINYSNAYNKVDLKYTVTPDMFLEEFIVKDKKTASKIERIRESMVLTNATYEEKDDGSVEFFDKETGEYLATIPKPVMYELYPRDTVELPQGGTLEEQVKNSVEERRPTNYGLHYEIIQEGNKLFIDKVLDKEGKEWLLSSDREYPVVIDASISFGSEYVFNSATTSYTFVSALDSTHFVVAYRDFGNSNYGTAVIGTVSGSTISYGSEYVFNSADTKYTSVSALDSTYFVVAYRDDGDPSYGGTAVIGAVSGTSISFGSEYAFNSSTTYDTSVSALDNTHFVVAYRDDGNSSYGTAVIGTVSGTTIYYGSEYLFNSASSSYISVSALNSTHFVVAYQDYGNSSYGTAVIGTVSGTTIAFGGEYLFNSGSTNYISVSALDSTHFVVAYQDYGSSRYGRAVIGTVSGSIISFGSEYLFNSATTYYTSVSALNSTHFVVVYNDDGNSRYGTAVVGTVSDSSISFSSEYEFNSAETTYTSVSALDSTHFVVAYRDDDNSRYGTAVVGEHLFPTNDSLTFGNPYQGSGNDVVADNTTEWLFLVKISHSSLDYTDLNTVVLRLANSSDNTAPYDALKFTWTQATNTFAETSDTQNAATITSTGTDSHCSGKSCRLAFKIKFNNNFTNKLTNYSAELYTTDDDGFTDEDSYSSFYQVKGYYSSGEQYWISETQDAGSGNTYKPNNLLVSWTLDGTDNNAPKFQVLGSSTGDFTGEETIYPNGSGTYYRDGGTYDINNGAGLDISSEVTQEFRYWKVKAYLNTGTDRSDTPSIQRIRLRVSFPLILQTSNQYVGIGTTTPDYKLDVRGGTVAGAGAYVNTSSHSSLKENFLDVSVLEKIDQLRINSWQYKPEFASGDFSRHLYPTTDEFYEAFGLGRDEFTISPEDIAGVALKGVQELNMKIQEMNSKFSTDSFNAESYTISGEALAGSIVSVDSNLPKGAIVADQDNDSLIGVISTPSGAVMDVDGDFQVESDTKVVYRNEQAPVALTGVVPVLVTSENGNIQTGDHIGISTIPGYGSRMTASGQTVGKAVEPLKTTNCESATSVSAITWAEDDDRNTLKPCFTLPDGTIVGKVLVAVNISWYDPISENLMKYTEDKQLLSFKSSLATENNKYDLGTEENRWKNIYSQGSIQLGEEGSSGSIKYDIEENIFKFSNDGTNWISLGESTKTITLSAEYEGAVLSADGSNNRGMMTSDSEGTESKYMNYYKWSSDQPVLQDYDIRVRFTLPNDFENWSNDAIKIHYSTETTNKEISKLDTYLFEQNFEIVDTQQLDLFSQNPGEWTKTIIKSENIKQCSKAGDTCILVIRGYSSNNYYVKVGDIELTYRREL